MAGRWGAPVARRLDSSRATRSPLPSPGLIIDEAQSVEGPAGPIPPRRERSIRRTATMDMLWPEGPTGPLELRGRARDAVTADPTEPPRVVREASLDALLRDRVIESIETVPDAAGIPDLVGQRGGGHLRGALATLVPEVRASGSPLYLLLDDISGTSLIGGVAFVRQPEFRPNDAGERRRGPSASDMEGVCIGFAPGSSALTEVTEHMGPPRMRPVGPLVHPDDPDGWHVLPDMPRIGTRRARFIDVRVDGDRVSIESGFQDSTDDPDHGRIGIHEYRLHATADLTTGRLDSLDATPHILPFRECPSAVASSRSIVDAPLSDLRDVVLERLAKTSGCTHLNDALRALAEVPMLVNELVKEASGN